MARPQGLRSCGGCTECCTVVPVDLVTLQKPAYARCPHLSEAFEAKGPGCGIYPTRPTTCRAWSCVWLDSPVLPDELRPDRCGVTVDPTVDLIRVDGEEKPAIQCWVSPGHEETALENPLVHGLIRSLLRDNKMSFILWRMKDPEGEQWARVIGCDDTGMLHVGPATKNRPDLGDEASRFWRAMELMQPTET